MKISNDTILFDDSDLAQLSPALQKGLQQYVGTNTDPDTGEFLVTPASVLNAAVAGILDGATKLITKAQSDNLTDLAGALAIADDATKAKVQVFLDQAFVAAGISPKPQPAPVFESEQTTTLTPLKK